MQHQSDTARLLGQEASLPKGKAPSPECPAERGGTIVSVRANVVKVTSINDMAEQFSAVLALQFRWVDPLLKDFKGEVAYWEPGLSSEMAGPVQRRRARIVQPLMVQPLMEEKLLLEVDPKEDFAVGDEVEATAEIPTKKNKDPAKQIYIMQAGEAGIVESVSLGNKELRVKWNSGKTSRVQFQDAKILARGSMKALDKKIQITVPRSNFMGKTEPDWKNDPLLFKPRWSFENQLGEMSLLFYERTLTHVSAEGGHVFEKYKIQVSFSQELNLHRFPFDEHVLSLKLTSEQHFELQRWKALKSEAGRGDLPTEWRQPGPPSLEVYDLRDDQVLQRCRIKILVKRKPGFFFKHIILMMFLLGLSSTCVVLIDPGNVDKRAAVLLTTLLVMAAYKHMTSQWIPRKPYYTLLDVYTLIGFCVQLFVLLESILIAFWGCESIDDHDKKFDGFFNISESGYLRTPPEFECRANLGSIDKSILSITYGTWMLLHIAAFGIASRRKLL